MPTSREALDDFLTRQPEPKFEVRGKSEAWLRDLIHRTTGLEWSPKVSWRGDGRDLRQLEAIAFTLVVKQVLLLYRPRTGKTRITVDVLQHLVRVGWVRRALIIAHSPLGVSEWERQIPIFSDLDLSIVRSGPKAEDDFLSALAKQDHGIVTTWSTLQSIFSAKREVTRGQRKGSQKFYADLLALRAVEPEFNMIAVDEIHGVNDPSSLRATMIQDLAPEGHQKWAVGLTGTPFGRDPFGLWNQARIVDGGKTLSKSYYFFEEAFGRQVRNYARRGAMETVFDAKRMPTLRAKLNHMILECRLEDIQDVNVIANPVPLKMLREQEKAYRELIAEMLAEQAEESVTRTSNIFVRLRQVASGYRVFTDADGVERTMHFPSAKLAWLEEFLPMVDRGLKVIIFHEFVESGRRLTQLLGKLKIEHAWLWGGSPSKLDAKDDFQYRNVPVLVANHATGGTGVDLSAADYVCVYESPVGVIGRDQMRARPLARGNRVLVMDDLVCAPVERKILQFHEEGRALSEMFSKPRQLARLLS
jgi:SNF2-related domain